MSKKRWFVERQLWNCAIGLHCRDGDKYVKFIRELHEIDISTAPSGGELRLDYDEAQQLMNELWLAGFRPENGAGALAHVESIKAHLDDLRTVAFHALKIPRD